MLAAAAPRAVPSVPALQRLEGVGNARDFAEACSKIAPGKMFRSANPIGATRTDVEILRQQLGICELVRAAQAAGVPPCHHSVCHSTCQRARAGSMLCFRSICAHGWSGGRISQGSSCRTLSSGTCGSRAACSG